MARTPQLIHTFDPMLLDLGYLKLWYYGMAYAVGFLGIHLWLMRRRSHLALDARDVYRLSILLALFVLAVGHAVEVVFYEWWYYRRHPWQILNYANGGMATHGVLLGATMAIWVFCRLRGGGFLEVADELTIPAAFFMGVGRLGNFINGENYGPVTEVWWAVKFPYAEGFRHPVDLYDGFKNIAIIPLLLLARRKVPHAPGRLLARFVFWYGFLRLATDCFREYGADFLGIGRGQYLNLTMAVVGALVMILWESRTAKPDGRPSSAPRFTLHPVAEGSGLWPWRAVFAGILLFTLTIPSGWSQGWLGHLKRQQSPGADLSVLTHR